MSKPLRIGIVAGEPSGDILGSGLIKALKNKYPDAIFEGIGGELMQQAGCRSLFPMERLSVMGLVEVLSRLFELLSIRRQLRDYFLNNPPDVFIGVDAPDFNFKLEGWLKAAGIPTVHYVSPSVWAWKQKRIYSIKKTTDLVLSLFPFEEKYYESTEQKIVFVGHPLASTLPDSVNLDSARKRFAVTEKERIIALLPGSRLSEIKYLSKPFLDTARWLTEHLPQVRFIIPAANERCHDYLHQIIQADYQDLNVQLVLKNSREVMVISESILIASGTATLEAALFKKPMVVAYKMAGLTYAIYSRLIKTRFISLPNLLVNEPLVDEILQNRVRSDVLGPALMKSLDQQQYIINRFTEIEAQLKQNASERAAAAVIELLVEKNKTHE